MLTTDGSLPGAYSTAAARVAVRRSGCRRKPTSLVFLLPFQPLVEKMTLLVEYGRTSKIRTLRLAAE